MVFRQSEKSEGLRWHDAVSPTGHGFVNISHPERYDLPPGIENPSGIESFSVSMFHQLHCLVSCHAAWLTVRSRLDIYVTY